MAILWKTGSEFTTEYPDGYGKPSVLVPRPTYAGAVLGTTDSYERIMSDVWATIHSAMVWDGEKVTNVAVGNSEFGSTGTVKIDATPDVLAAASVYWAAEAVKKAEAEKASAAAAALYEASRVAKGKEVTVVRGRKLPKGFAGRVFWMGSTKYGLRVGLETADGKREFTAIGNVEVANPAAYL